MPSIRNADTINGSGIALSGLSGNVGDMVYVANGDGSGNPFYWSCELSSATVDHLTVEAVSGVSGTRWIRSLQNRNMTVVTVANDTDTVTFAGLDGDFDGSYTIDYYLPTAGATINLQPNADTGNVLFDGSFNNGTGNPASFNGTTILLGSAATEAVGYVRIQAHSGTAKFFRVLMRQIEAGGTFVYDIGGRWNVTTKITSLVIKAASGNNIKAGSQFILYKSVSVT